MVQMSKEEIHVRINAMSDAQAEVRLEELRALLRTIAPNMDTPPEAIPLELLDELVLLKPRLGS